MSTTREQFIRTTCELLEAQGYHATGLNQIVMESGSPKGSLYYHFPEGKEELAAEAIAYTGEQVAARIRQNLRHGGDGAEAVAQTVGRFVRRIADNVEASGFRSGGPLMTVAMETATSSERLNRACRQAYGLLQEAFAASFAANGFDAGRAEELATFVVSSIEGGIVLSRTSHTGDPLRRVADELEWIVEAAGKR